MVEGHLKKGHRVVIAGTLEHQKWTGNDGFPRSTFQIIANDIQFMHPKGDQASPDFVKEEIPEEQIA